MSCHISIGRNPKSSITVSQTYDRVSNDHAEIDMRDGNIYFTDHSTNGTVINGKKIHNDTVILSRTEEIMLAGEWPLDWNTINCYLPVTEPQAAGGHRSTERWQQGHRATERWNNSSNDIPYSGKSATPSGGFVLASCGYSSGETVLTPADEAYINGWSWGAFLLNWIWAICHRIYWPLVMLIPVICDRLTSFFPFESGLYDLLKLITIIGNIANIGIAVYLGLTGRRMAWREMTPDIDRLRTSERKWAIGGLIYLLLLLMLVAVIFIMIRELA